MKYKPGSMSEVVDQSMDQSHKLNDLTLSSYLAMMMLMRMNHAAYLYLLGHIGGKPIINQHLSESRPESG